MTTETKILPSEACHFYTKSGEPVYEVPKAKGDGMRPTTIEDARKLNLVPSVTSIIAIAAKPGLQKWKLQQMLHAALTLPRLPDETEDAFAERVIEDSESQSKKAMERGTELHAVIEEWIRSGWMNDKTVIWNEHVRNVALTLKQYGIDLTKGKAEHSFASPLGYGGKLDWHNDEVLIDFKTKARIENGKRLAWDEHPMQLAAYSMGIKWSHDASRFLRCINVFIGVDDCQVRVHEHSPKDIKKSWEKFQHLLAYWKLAKGL